MMVIEDDGILEADHMVATIAVSKVPTTHTGLLKCGWSTGVKQG